MLSICIGWQACFRPSEALSIICSSPQQLRLDHDHSLHDQIIENIQDFQDIRLSNQSVKWNEERKSGDVTGSDLATSVWTAHHDTHLSFSCWTRESRGQQVSEDEVLGLDITRIRLSNRNTPGRMIASSSRSNLIACRARPSRQALSCRAFGGTSTGLFKEEQKVKVVTPVILFSVPKHQEKGLNIQGFEGVVAKVTRSM